MRHVAPVLSVCIAIAFAAGCYGIEEDTVPGDTATGADGSGTGGDGGGGLDIGGVGGECASDLNCADPWPWCDTNKGLCVMCALDSHCAPDACDTGTNRCTGIGEDGGAPSDTGHPYDAGQPKDTGHPSDAGQPKDTGHPYDAGQPKDTGHPADAGNIDPCKGVTCSGHGQCKQSGGAASCTCDSGYVPSGLTCVENNACGGCSGHGTCKTWTDASVCACDPGYTPSDNAGRDCVPTGTVCKGGAFSYDWNDDGTLEATFDPVAYECLMFELVNLTRATHDNEGTNECHTPLRYSLEWSAHGRNHSKKQSDRGGLFHEDYPMSQNCAYGCDPACEMNMYMTGANEGHCDPLSHHCNIMRCGVSYIGIGFWPLDNGTWNTQNIY